MILIPSVVAQKNQPAPRQCQNEIRVAIPIKISGGNGINFRCRQAFQSEFVGGFAKIAIAEIAPDAESGADGNNIKPPIVVVIDQRQLPYFGGVSGKIGMSFCSAKYYFQSAGRGDDQVGTQIIVEIATGDDMAGRPVGGRIGGGERGASKFLEPERRLTVASDQQVHHVVVVPIGDVDFARVRDRDRNAAGGGAINEITIAEITKNLHAAVWRDGEQIKLAGEIQIGQGAGGGFQIFDAGGAGDFAGGAIGLKLENMSAVATEHDDILEAAILKIADQAARIFCAGNRRKLFGARLKFSRLVFQQSKGVRFTYKKAVTTVVIEIDDADGSAEILGATGEDVLGGIGEANLHSGLRRAFHGESGSSCGVSAAFVGGRGGRRG